MIETARQVSKLDVQGIKIHLLHLLNKTPMVKQFEKGLVELMSFDDYIDVVVKQIELLLPVSSAYCSAGRPNASQPIG